MKYINHLKVLSVGLSLLVGTAALAMEKSPEAKTRDQVQTKTARLLIARFEKDRDTKDLVKAKELLEAAAAAGNNDAKWSLGELYITLAAELGLDTDEETLVKGLLLWREAAQGGHRQAVVFMNSYRETNQRRADEGDAKFIYVMAFVFPHKNAIAAGQEQRNAAFLIGNAYFHGIERAVNLAKAKKFLLMAGTVRALLLLSEVAFREGDVAAAIAYLEEAKARGSFSAGMRQSFLASILRQISFHGSRVEL